MLLDGLIAFDAAAAVAVVVVYLVWRRKRSVSAITYAPVAQQ